MGRATPHPIAIAGMHRSGTSMITRALHDAGLHLIAEDEAELIRAADDNPEGFWENKAIVACNDDLLEATGGAWDHPPELLPQGADDPRVADLVEPARAALDALRAHERWGFKDPRVCLTAPFWLDLEPDLRFVICVRHPLEVALSLKRRNQNSYSLGLALWERYYSAVLDAVPRDRRIVSHYDSFFTDPEGELSRVCAFAGLDPATATVRGDLRHHTVDVGLADAGVSDTVRTLYAELCKEAGVAIPAEPPADEGRVHRLVLDGAVATRHAEQRLAAIERLEERELQFRAEHGANEEALRTRVRDLERQLSDTRAQALTRLDEMARQLRVVEHEVAPGPVKRFVRRAAKKTLRTGKRAVGKGRATAVPAARRAAARLPEPTQDQLRRVQRGAAHPLPAAKSASRKAVPAVTTRTRTQARAAARRLPPPAQARLRVTWQRVRRVRAAPKPAARRAVAKLPDPAQAATRRAWNASAPVRRRGMRVARRLGPGPRGARAPKGPPLKDWKPGYEALVRDAVPEGATWIAMTPGSPATVRDVRSPRGTRFPDTPRGAPLADDLSNIAHLEALHCAGNRYLVVPEGSRRWLRRQAELRDHVVGTYRCLADAPDAGMVFDLDTPAAPADRSLRGEVRRLTAARDHDPAVLAWTDLDVASELPGVTTFRPPGDGALPYVDDSVEIVVRDEDHDARDARRVATVGVVTIAAGPAGIEVRGVEDLAAPATAGAHRVLVRAVAPEPERAWARALARRVADAGADLELGGRLDAIASDDHDVVLVVEPDVLPLPGAIEAAAAWVTEHPDSAVTGKVLRNDGRIDSAGGIVFADRSVALVAEGSDAVRAPWHDYTRPACWAPGLVAATTSLWARVDGPRGAPPRTFAREWCAAVWEQGGRVVYDPAIVAVRVRGRGGEASDPLPASAWQRVLDLRPARPGRLGDGEWRYLLAHDDVDACRG